ncbi:PLP-dependent aminotransferase family protein [Herbaspirillum sp. YR522]|uniref:MocR-like pyridoxine biosynthesis transcription factor PdxR n=1 Tax=Herbaspirillum sp. YR522 TaxID=1144342 RepID=UPI00026FAAAE|nr:PLP-dependent aminotransferase family protein [Herbaspirillum sp. YR522]EJN08787.1 transcriptional regulator with HTH domain and aminotransferase domain containing protein [Herbaspirillum sp. YR522]
MKTTLPHALLQLQTSTDTPYYRQIYTRLRNAIADGLLKPGHRIPSARALAAEMGLARGTIESAYALLTAEGYIEARAQAGTVVAPGVRPHAPTALPSARHPQHEVQSHADSGPAPVMPRAFQMGVPALDAFPRKIWARLAAREARATRSIDMLYPPPAGLASLRGEIARYLQLSRAISCAPQQVFVTAGYRDSLDLVTRALLRPGEQVWMEDPGYPPSASLLRGAGMQLVGVPVDAQGLQVEQGLLLAPDARAALVTPAHQSPLCVTLSLQRRIALLEWAARRRAWVIEDDYDGEYRYDSRPLPSLKSLDRDDRVLYAGTFSKVLFPAIRLAYLVVPAAEVQRFEDAARCFSGGSPVLMQKAVAGFMADGHFARHIQRMRRLYAQRRELAAAGLADVLGRAVQMETTPGGMHLLMRLKGRRSDRLLAQRMRDAGMFSRALSECTLDRRHDLTPMLMLGFTNITSREQAQELGRRILALL